MGQVPIIGGMHDLVRFGSLRIWPERGRICIEDANTNSYENISVKEALERMHALSDMVSNSVGRVKGASKYFPALEKHQDFLDEMVIVIRKAKEQGMPEDPRARREMARRQPTTLVVPDLSSLD
jgi:hypothetical protein